MRCVSKITQWILSIVRLGIYGYDLKLKFLPRKLRVGKCDTMTICNVLELETIQMSTSCMQSSSPLQTPFHFTLHCLHTTKTKSLHTSAFSIFWLLPCSHVFLVADTDTAFIILYNHDTMLAIPKAMAMP